jgi:uncharacterized repeat protein (TIGR01451 family)
VVADNTAVLTASGVRILNASPTWQQTTIARNSGAEGSGLLLSGGTTTLLNTIFAEQAIGVQNESGIVTTTATLWDNVPQPTVGTVQENLSQTGSAAFTADGYHLTAVSVAIDNGIDSGVLTDIDDLPRPIGAGFDLGAVEWRSLTAVKSASTAVSEPGAIFTYTINLSQPSNDGLSVMLTDTLPSEVIFVGPLVTSSGSGAYCTGVITWTGAVYSHTAVSIQFPVQLPATLAPGTVISNQAILEDSFGVYATNTAVVSVPAKVYLPTILR